MFVHPLYVLILLLKYGILLALFSAEMDQVFELFKVSQTGWSWSGLLIVIVVSGFNISMVFLLHRLPINWEWLDSKKLAKKILKLTE
jgi:hypothetical protein